MRHTAGELIRPRAERGLGELFGGFLALALVSFGGAVPWARRALVEQRRWVSGEEFTSTLSFCQLLPGAPALNLAIVIGQRERGLAGALAALVGFVGIPVLISLVLGAVHAATGEVAWMRGALTGMGAAAAGLLFTTTIKVAAPVVRAHPLHAISLMALTFTAIAVASLPLLWTMLVLAPVSVALIARPRR